MPGKWPPGRPQGGIPGTETPLAANQPTEGREAGWDRVAATRTPLAVLDVGELPGGKRGQDIP